MFCCQAIDATESQLYEFMDLAKLAEIGKITSGIFLPIIAAIGSLVAYQQYKITKIKLRFDLYEKRFSICEEYLKFGLKVIEGEDISPEDYLNLTDSLYLAEFLFDRKVVNRLRKFRENAKSWRRVRVGSSDESKISNLRLEETELINFFRKETDNLFTLFSPYLRITAK